MMMMMMIHIHARRLYIYTIFKVKVLCFFKTSFLLSTTPLRVMRMMTIL